MHSTNVETVEQLMKVSLEQIVWTSVALLIVSVCLSVSGLLLMSIVSLFGQ